MNIAIDIGNLAVGLGTAAIALVTFYSVKRTEKSGRNQRIAEFRKEWIENLRSHLAEFNALYFNVTALKGIMDLHKKNDEKSRLAEDENQYKTAVVRLRYVQQYLILMLNQNEDSHKNLSILMEDMISDFRGKEPKIPKDKWPNFSVLARKVLKEEWKRVTTETSKES